MAVSRIFWYRIGAVPAPSCAQKHAEGARALASRATLPPRQSAIATYRSRPRLPSPATRCTMCQSSPFSGIMLSMALRAPAGRFLLLCGERVQLLPECLRRVQPLRRHGAERDMVLGQRERSSAGFERFPVPLQQRIDGGFGAAGRRRQQRAGGQANQIDGVRQAPRFVEIVDAPDQAAFDIAPGSEVLDMQVAHGQNNRRLGLLRTDFGPDLGPAIEGGAQKGERAGPHLRVFEGEVGSQQPDMLGEPCLVFSGSFANVHSRHTPAVSIHFNPPAALGPKRSQSIRARAAFFMSTCRAGLSSRKAASELIRGSWLESTTARSSLRWRISSQASNGEDSGSSAPVRTISPL